MTMAILKMRDVLVSRIPLWTYCNCNDFERYETLPKFRHITDNATKSNPENAINKLFKVRPLLELIRNNCIKIKCEHCHFIDEQIIPVKTKCSEGVKQYNPICGVGGGGFKNMVRAGHSDMIYGSSMYGGRYSAGAKKFVWKSLF